MVGMKVAVGLLRGVGLSKTYKQEGIPGGILRPEHRPDAVCSGILRLDGGRGGSMRQTRLSLTELGPCEESKDSSK